MMDRHGVALLNAFIDLIFMRWRAASNGTCVRDVVATRRATSTDLRFDDPCSAV
jgi:hypothetical protein